MYFTIPQEAPSTPVLSLDALDAYQRLRRHALALARLSSSFTREASLVTDAYLRALTVAETADWADLVAAADQLVRHSESVDSILHLDLAATSAHDFFAQLVRENADLLNADLLEEACAVA